MVKPLEASMKLNTLKAENFTPKEKAQKNLVKTTLLKSKID